jgi:hypothetical protein
VPVEETGGDEGHCRDLSERIICLNVKTMVYIRNSARLSFLTDRSI